MVDLIPTSAFGLTEAKTLSAGGIELAERADIALASLALRHGAPQPSPFGLSLPGPGGRTEVANLSAFWTGPNQWMIEAPGTAESDFAARVRRETPGQSVTEQTDGWLAIDITAGSAKDLGRLSERLFDLPPGQVGTGSAQRTGMHHMSVFVLGLSESSLRVWGMRSIAGSLWHSIETAAIRLAA